MWVIGGNKFGNLNDVWNSSNGINWAQTTASVPFLGGYLASAVTFDDGSGSKIWVIGGVTPPGGGVSEVWKSADGANWSAATTTAAFGARWGHTSLINGSPTSMWVIGGRSSSSAYLNDVWSSPDGVTWNQTTAAANFSYRENHASVLFNGKMWVIGGGDASNLFNDVWSSADGIIWSQVLANGSASSAHFSARAGHTCAVFNGAIWLVGGWDGTTDKNDVWTSIDGANWNEVASGLAFPIRDSHTSLVFNSSLWVIAGSSLYPLVWYADVWHSP